MLVISDLIVAIFTVAYSIVISGGTGTGQTVIFISLATTTLEITF